MDLPRQRLGLWLMTGGLYITGIMNAFHILLNMTINPFHISINNEYMAVCSHDLNP